MEEEGSAVWNTESVEKPVVAMDGKIYFLPVSEFGGAAKLLYARFFDTPSYEPEPPPADAQVEISTTITSVSVPLADPPGSLLTMTLARQSFLGAFLLTYLLDREIYTGRVTPFVPLLSDAFRITTLPPSFRRADPRSTSARNIWARALERLLTSGGGSGGGGGGGRASTISAETPLYCIVTPNLGPSLRSLLRSPQQAWPWKARWAATFQLLHTFTAFGAIRLLHGRVSLDAICVRVVPPSSRVLERHFRCTFKASPTTTTTLRFVTFQEKERVLDLTVQDFSEAQQFLPRTQERLPLQSFGEPRLAQEAAAAAAVGGQKMFQSPEQWLLLHFRDPELLGSRAAPFLFATEVFSVAQLLLSLLTQTDFSLDRDEASLRALLRHTGVPEQLASVWAKHPFSSGESRILALSALLYGIPDEETRQMYQTFSFPSPIAREFVVTSPPETAAARTFLRSLNQGLERGRLAHETDLRSGVFQSVYDRFWGDQEQWVERIEGLLDEIEIPSLKQARERISSQAAAIAYRDRCLELEQAILSLSELARVTRARSNPSLQGIFSLLPNPREARKGGSLLEWVRARIARIELLLRRWTDGSIARNQERMEELIQFFELVQPILSSQQEGYAFSHLRRLMQSAPTTTTTPQFRFLPLLQRALSWNYRQRPTCRDLLLQQPDIYAPVYLRAKETSSVQRSAAAERVELWNINLADVTVTVPSSSSDKPTAAAAAAAEGEKVKKQRVQASLLGIASMEYQACASPSCPNDAQFRRQQRTKENIFDAPLAFCSAACSAAHWVLYQSRTQSCTYYPGEEEEEEEEEKEEEYK
jgi:hypothetical protein